MQEKVCSSCKKSKPLEDFPFRDKKKGTYRATCKECHNAYMREHYKKNRAQIDSLKDGKSCEKCGYNKCSAALDYHHIDPNSKIDTVARLSTHSDVKQAVLETEKCVLLCANCHREFHFLEQQNGITLEQFLNNNC